MMSKKTIRIICLILAGLMVLGAFSIVFQVFAADTAVPNTGVEEYILPLAIILGVCLIVIVALILLPKMKKKAPEAKTETKTKKIDE